MKNCANFVLSACFLLFTLNTRMEGQPATNWLSVPHAKLCVTEGALEQSSGNRMSVNVPKMRAFVSPISARPQERSRSAPVKCVASLA
jgi:hypothetical protein